MSSKPTKEKLGTPKDPPSPPKSTDTPSCYLEPNPPPKECSNASFVLQTLAISFTVFALLRYPESYEWLDQTLPFSLSNKYIIRAVVAILSSVWAGLVLGISFIEAPVKFTPPSVSRLVALDIGRTVFLALNKVEIILAQTIMLVQMQLNKDHLNTTMRMVLYSTAPIILFYQVLYLQPELDERARKHIMKVPVEDSSIHLLYVILEITKLLLLVAIPIHFLIYLQPIVAGH